jgi:site-specific DNA-methyltransferase (cytosine-N4-specific)
MNKFLLLEIAAKSKMKGIQLNMNKIDWDFTEVNTKQTSHGYHSYPAMLVPQIASELISEFGKKAKVLFDPFCGTGTTLVEANLNGINAIGTDLNPLARLIAKTKTTKIEIQSLDLFIKDFYEYLFSFRYGFEKNKSVVFPRSSNTGHWFAKNVISDLSIIKTYIDDITEESIKDFFKVAFSQTIRDCSKTRKNEFKLYKMDKEKLKTFKPDVFSFFERNIAKNRLGLLKFNEQKVTDAISHIYDFNTVHSIPTEIISPKSVGIVITSPPYGDSQTTVAYGQFSRLSNEWLGYSQASKLDSFLLGGIKSKEIKRFPSGTLNNSISKINQIDDSRCKDVVSFYTDYQNSINNVAKVIKKNGFACYVVSNRCVKGVTLKTDLITRDFFEQAGFKHIDTIGRKISYKRMPRKNSPGGVTGETKTLMNKEYIVILQKK